MKTQSETLTKNETKALAVLALHTSDAKPTCDLSLRAFCNEGHLPLGSAINALKGLESRGLIRRNPVMKGDTIRGYTYTVLSCVHASAAALTPQTTNEVASAGRACRPATAAGRACLDETAGAIATSNGRDGVPPPSADPCPVATAPSVATAAEPTHTPTDDYEYCLDDDKPYAPSLNEVTDLLDKMDRLYNLNDVRAEYHRLNEQGWCFQDDNSPIDWRMHFICRFRQRKSA